MKICFWGVVSGALKGTQEGGGEYQQSEIIKNLYLKGIEVVVIDFECQEDEEIYGIKFLSLKKRIRFKLDKYKVFYSMLKHVDADVYYAVMRSSIHLLGLLAAKRNNGKFIYHVASDLDTLGLKERWNGYYKNISSLKRLILHFIHAEILFPFVLRNADLIVTQHKQQTKNLNRFKGKEIIEIPPLYEIKSDFKVKYSSKLSPSNNKYYIIISFLDKRKGVLQLEYLIKKLNKKIFLIIGPPRDKYGKIFVDKTKKMNNVICLEYLRYEELLSYLKGAEGLISTSPYEGFPTVFLEAWSFGIPVFSLFVDPSGVISRNNLGRYYSGNFDLMITELAEQKFLFDKNEIKNYIICNHSPDKLINNLISTIEKIK